jgi:hypothetical protein
MLGGVESLWAIYMSAMNNLGKAAIMILMAGAVVAIGAEELRRKTHKIEVSEESGQRMMKILNPDHDFKDGALAERVQRDEESAAARAQLKNDQPTPPQEREHLDPTGLRSILNKLLP